MSTETRKGFTPGPWTTTGIDRETTVSAKNSHGSYVWVADTFHSADDLGECEANARLIAVAPEMYEALRGLLDIGQEEVMERLVFGVSDKTPTYQQAEAALAKVDK